MGTEFGKEVGAALGGIVKDAVKGVEGALTEGRSVVLIVANHTDQQLEKVGDNHDHGGFAVPPRAIPPHNVLVFGSQSSGFLTGTEGNTTFAGNGFTMTVNWDNPWAGTNSSDASLAGPNAAAFHVGHSTGSGNQSAQMIYEIFPNQAPSPAPSPSSPGTRLGVSSGRAVAAPARMPEHLDVFWVGPDGAVGTTWWHGAAGMSWGDHQPFPISGPNAAQSGSSVAAVTRMPEHLDVFWVGPDGAVGSTWWHGAAGMNWGDHQPFAISGPNAALPGSGLAAVTRMPEHLDVFWVGPDGAVGTTWWHGAAGMNWGDHQPFAISGPNAARPGSSVAAVARMPEHLDVFWVGPDGAVMSTWWHGAAGMNWGDHQPFAISGPNAAQ